MPKQFKKKVKDFQETSDNMELINDYLVQIDLLIHAIDWTALYADYPDPGGGLPPPPPPSWPP